MSLYSEVTSVIPGTRVDVGWNQKLHTYFVQAFEGSSKSNVVFMAGHNEPFELRSLYALVQATWTLVDWTKEREVLSQLRDDPMIEERAYLLQTSIAEAKKDGREALTEMVLDTFTAWERASSATQPTAPEGTISFDQARRRS